MLLTSRTEKPVALLTAGFRGRAETPHSATAQCHSPVLQHGDAPSWEENIRPEHGDPGLHLLAQQLAQKILLTCSIETSPSPPNSTFIYKTRALLFGFPFRIIFYRFEMLNAIL